MDLRPSLLRREGLGVSYRTDRDGHVSGNVYNENGEVRIPPVLVTGRGLNSLEECHPLGVTGISRLHLHKVYSGGNPRAVIADTFPPDAV